MRRVRHAFIFFLLVLNGCGPSVLSPYGDRNAVSPNPDGTPRQRERPHEGVDFGPANIGDAVIASADGLVVDVSAEEDYGIEIRVLHDGVALDRESQGARYMTGYLHLRKASVRPGQRVARGDAIGEVGLFWASGGVVHVHWKLCRGGCSETLDPVSKTVGCYKRGAEYTSGTLALTYPLRC